MFICFQSLILEPSFCDLREAWETDFLQTIGRQRPWRWAGWWEGSVSRRLLRFLLNNSNPSQFHMISSISQSHGSQTLTGTDIIWRVYKRLLAFISRAPGSVILEWGQEFTFLTFPGDAKASSLETHRETPCNSERRKGILMDLWS